jgi:hypothetical protein
VVPSLTPKGDCGGLREVVDSRRYTVDRLIEIFCRGIRCERPQSNTNDHSGAEDESFLIPFRNCPSFFSRSSVDSSDVSLQHRR